MIERKGWEEFKKIGLLWYVNRLLHLFGWVLVFEYIDDDKVVCYPARTKFRGFDGESESKGFINLTSYLKGNINVLMEEAKE